jgi:AcrR family transcriptional regulator
MTSPLQTPDPSDSPAPGRDRILDCAASFFVERGYTATSLRDIARAAGMKAGSLYYHFESKEDLLAAVFRRGIDVMVTAFEEAENATRDREARTRIEAHVRAHLSALFEYGPYTAAHVTLFHRAPERVKSAIVPERDAYEAMWSRLLDALAESQVLAPGTSVGLSRLILFGAMNASIEWFDPQQGDLDDFARAITDQFWSGVASAEARSGSHRSQPRGGRR